MTKEQWGTVKEKLLKNVGQSNYRNWIEPLVFDRMDEGVAVIGAPNSYAGTYVARNFGDLILGEVSAVYDQVRRLEFIVNKAANTNASQPARPAAMEVEPTAEAPASAPAPAVAATPARTGLDAMLQPAPLDPRFTFDRFVVGKPNELAHAAARRVAEGGPVTFNPLFLYGGVGLGKTHLMHAIANELQVNRPELTVVYLSAEQFMYRFVQAIRERRTMDFKSLFRTVDVLMVDDIQFIAGKDSTQEEFFHTFNALVDQNKQIILSGDRAPGEMTDMEERIRSRMQCGLIVDLHPTDYELRLGILQCKLDAHRDQYPDLKIAPGVLEFLAHRISTNVRVLEGALTRLFAFSSLVGREITLDLTQECLADILRASDKKITVEEIQRKVAEHFNIRMSDLIGPKRVRTFARPRQIAMYLAKTLTSRSLPEIGRRFGGRDHTTVIHGVKRVEELKVQDSQIAEDVEMLRRALEA
ncbi:chromosomal replication initiator protein DnaA [Pseudooceanicola onchidii]|uniref:chromosomal replication initiator protein DnaA n=1 Tax=Pseudooceanicola onchidii TaxID=2562279 RepID=UPI0010AAEADD|nr:chromosomal replication initiator protein DnaA [Pseudooceanicola onchidii]